MNIPRLVLLSTLFSTCVAGTLAAQAPASPAAALVRAVARRGCGRPPDRVYYFPVYGAAGNWGARNHLVVQSAEAVSTVRITYGDAARQGSARAERPVTGTWSADAVGDCPGGHGTLELAMISAPRPDGTTVYELRGRAQRIERPGLGSSDDAVEVRFVGVCGRHRDMVMEIWPYATGNPDMAGLHPQPERYQLRGNVDCNPPGGASSAPEPMPLAGPVTSH
jgi:hypothetical protein